MAADAFISLSHRENFGYTVAEALSSGIPVILSPGNNLSYDIRHLNCGWLLADDNPVTAIKAVNEFAVTPGEQLVEMGRRGQQWAQAELSPEMFKSQLHVLALEPVEKAKQTH
jgi:glycosyltransferase involved in cell wall biosynthesis